MSLYFFKYQGAGNDFILIDDRSGDFPESKNLVEHLCDRRFGIGADGVMLIKHSKKADVHLDFMNPDGSRSFCGNGSRCGLRFAQLVGMVDSHCRFEAIDGIHSGVIHSDSVRISMQDVVELHSHSLGQMLNTGSPHLIIQHDDLDSLDVNAEGSFIRHSEEFKEEGVNVNFVKVIGDRKISIRTYERGVENETLSCGTGVTAAALAFAAWEELPDGTIKVKSLGGDLNVDFKRKEVGFVDIWLEGPAEKVFSGEIVI